MYCLLNIFSLFFAQFLRGQYPAPLRISIYCLLDNQLANCHTLIFGKDSHRVNTGSNRSYNAS